MVRICSDINTKIHQQQTSIDHHQKSFLNVDYWKKQLIISNPMLKKPHDSTKLYSFDSVFNTDEHQVNYLLNLFD